MGEAQIVVCLQVGWEHGFNKKLYAVFLVIQLCVFEFLHCVKAEQVPKDQEILFLMFISMTSFGLQKLPNRYDAVFLNLDLLIWSHICIEKNRRTIEIGLFLHQALSQQTHSPMVGWLAGPSVISPRLEKEWVNGWLAQVFQGSLSQQHGCLRELEPTSWGNHMVGCPRQLGLANHSPRLKLIVESHLFLFPLNENHAGRRWLEKDLNLGCLTY